MIAIFEGSVVNIELVILLFLCIIFGLVLCERKGYLSKQTMSNLTEQMRKYAVTPRLAATDLSLDQLGEMSVERKVDYIKSQLNPLAIKMSPPNTNNLITTVQSLTTFANFAQTDKQQTGAVVWFPQRGAISVNRMGYFPSGTQMSHSTNTSGGNPGWFKGTYFKTGPSTAYVGVSAVLTTNLFAPVQPTEDVAIRPPIQKSFSQGRVVAGAINVRSSTTSGDNVRLSGTLSGSALSDTRDAVGLAPPSLKQQAITEKDGHVSVPAQEGMVMLLGPDIKSEYSPLDQTLTTENVDSAYLYDLLDGTELASGALTSTSLSHALWVSPYASLQSTVPADLPSQINVNPLAMDTAPEFRIKSRINYAASPTTDGQIQVIHYWFQQQVNPSTGDVSLIITSEPTPADGATPDESNNQRIFVPCAVGSYPKGTAAPYGTGAYDPYPMFPQASSVQMNGCYTSVAPSFRQPNWMWAGTMIIPSSTAAGDFSIYEIDFIAKNLYAQGNLSARVVRWDNIGAGSGGQNVSIDGEIQVEAVATGAIAPYVSADEYQAFDMNLLPFTAKLFNGPFPEFRRVYTGMQYAQMLMKFFPNISRLQLVEYIKNVNPGIAAQAAGIFSTLSDIMGSLGGGLSGMNNKYARMAGNALQTGAQLMPAVEGVANLIKGGARGNFVDEIEDMLPIPGLAKGTYDDSDLVEFFGDEGGDADARFQSYVSVKPDPATNRLKRGRRVVFEKAGVPAKWSLPAGQDWKVAAYVSPQQMKSVAAEVERLSNGAIKLSPQNCIEHQVPLGNSGRIKIYWEIPEQAARLRLQNRKYGGVEGGWFENYQTGGAIKSHRPVLAPGQKPTFRTEWSAPPKYGPKLPPKYGPKKMPKGYVPLQIAPQPQAPAANQGYVPPEYVAPEEERFATEEELLDALDDGGVRNRDGGDGAAFSEGEDEAARGRKYSRAEQSGASAGRYGRRGF